jgi:hypothetical protein
MGEDTKPIEFVPGKLYQLFYDEIGPDGRPHLRNITGELTRHSDGSITVRVQNGTEVIFPVGRWNKIQNAPIKMPESP